VESHRPYTFTVLVHDDDVKRYVFVLTDDTTGLMHRVAAAVASGRHVRCCIVAGSREREEQYLVSKGYSREPINL
jgi:hypothetical protein